MKPYYESGGITIYQGDSMNVLREIKSGSVDLIITDPPYFQPAAHYCPARDQGSPKRSIGDMSILELAFRSWCEEMSRVIKKSGTIYFFCDGQSYPIAFTALYPHAKYVRPLIWDKLTSFNGYTWRHQHEIIAWAELEGSQRVNTGDGDILKCRAVPVDERLHPAQKPVDLIKMLMLKHADATTILDPFCGSGTTLRAAKDIGRKAIGVEIESRYCEIAVSRMAQEVLFGEQPTK